MNQKDKYGLIIIILSIISRIFVVSIAWNYGIFVTALNKNYQGSTLTELGWIAGLAQGLGSLISPSYIWFSKKIGIKYAFLLGMFLCFISLLASSFVPNEHYLFFTYSIPFGIGSSLIFVMGSLVTGMYYPPNHKFHVSATVSVSLGFPIGFLVLNPLSDTLLNYYKNDWQAVQRIYSVLILVLLIFCAPFFTDKYADTCEHSEEVTDQIVFREDFLNLTSDHLSILVRTLWLLGLFFNTCANTSILLNLNGYFKTIDQTNMNANYFVLGLSDASFRIILALIGRYIKNNLSAMYILSSFIGFILSNLWSDYTIPMFNTIYCILYGICPAVLMSLMYSVNSEISGPNKISQSYTINVMVSGIGIILGPIISGFLLDNSNKNYETVFKLALRFYFLSIVLYSSMKFLLLKYSSKGLGLKIRNDQSSRKMDYIEFDNENN